ncbi:MAG: hypothetical protein WEE50_11445, partial [Chloroflexota bacterium]
LACGGSWMVKKDLIAAGDFAEMERLASEAVRLARSIRPGQAETPMIARKRVGEGAGHAI